ncbi:MAG TPA: GNAT family N-acetyltransferase [Burkholderiaceae bacterium]
MTVAFVALEDPAHIALLAAQMAQSDPWLTLGRTVEQCTAALSDATRERYLVRVDGDPAGFLIINMAGSVTGYIQTIFVSPAHRGSGLGTRIVDYAEASIFARQPNVFMCVSSFNAGARKLYARLGYSEVGVLSDLLVAGQDEILLRKTKGPVFNYRPS